MHYSRIGGSAKPAFNEPLRGVCQNHHMGLRRRTARKEWEDWVRNECTVCADAVVSTETMAHSRAVGAGMLIALYHFAPYPREVRRKTKKLWPVCEALCDELPDAYDYGFVRMIKVVVEKLDSLGVDAVPLLGRDQLLSKSPV